LVSFTLGAPTPIKKWWTGYMNIWYNYQFFDGAIGINKLKAKIPSYGAYVQQSFTLGKEFSAEISGWFNGPSFWGATWKTSSQGALDLGLQKLLLNKKMTLKMALTDVFFTAPWKANNNFGGTVISGGGDWESRTFKLSVNWRFGSNQIGSSRERKTGLESETKRIK
jgi:hypothetical protein